MNKLWVHIAGGFAFLTVVAIVALLGRDWIEISPVFLAIVVAVVGIGLVLRTRQALSPLSAITHVVEGIAAGDLKQRTLTRKGGYEVERLRVATNRMVGRLNAVSAQARDLADGNIGIKAVEKKVLQTQRLADADQRIKPNEGDLERSFIELINQRRRLTIQARMISKDQLTSRLLNQKIPGELGEAFGHMVQNLRLMAQRAVDISGGDLTTTIEGDGELASSFNQMVGRLRALVEQISGTAIHISTAAEQILAVLREQESAANHQAASVEETQRTMETLLSSAKKIAENAQHVFKLAEKTQGNNRTVSERITELKNHTERITEILEGIKRIADRSDLLALNASLEGMRAGEAGKGFTLVAAEMRRLAENITGSVSDIKGLVVDIGESSLATAAATDTGTRLSENTTDNALKITLITQQQKSGTEQVTQSMDELSSLINQDVAGTQQVTMAASELVDLADSLRGLVEKFELGSSASRTGAFALRRDSDQGRSSGLRHAGVSRSGETGRTSAISLDRKTQRPLADLAGGDRPKRPATGAGKVDVEESAVNKSESDDARAHDESAAVDTSSSTESTMAETSDIPADSGADQPTIEFSSQLSENQQHEMMHKMAAAGRGEVPQTLEAELGELDELSDFGDFDASDVSTGKLEDPSSIDDDLDALEREIDKKTSVSESGDHEQPSEKAEES